MQADAGKRGATSAILMWQCAWVERWVLALWMTKTLSGSIGEAVGLLSGEWAASAFVASIMRFGWQVLSGTEVGTHKGVLSFASVGHGELHAVLGLGSAR